METPQRAGATITRAFAKENSIQLTPGLQREPKSCARVPHLQHPSEGDPGRDVNSPQIDEAKEFDVVVKLEKVACWQKESPVDSPVVGTTINFAAVAMQESACVSSLQTGSPNSKSQGDPVSDDNTGAPVERHLPDDSPIRSSQGGAVSKDDSVVTVERIGASPQQAHAPPRVQAEITPGVLPFAVPRDDGRTLLVATVKQLPRYMEWTQSFKSKTQDKLQLSLNKTGSSSYWR